MALDESDVSFTLRALALKRTVRKGWTRVPGVREPESVADHSWGVALLALLAAARDPTLDAARLLRIAIAHDLAEAVVGDLVPGEYRDAAHKREIEARGLADLLAPLHPAQRDALEAAWREYDEGATRESRLVRDLDKVEMALQARAYAGEGGDSRALREFWASAVERCGDAGLRRLISALEPR